MARLGVAAAKLQKLVGPEWRILKALERKVNFIFKVTFRFHSNGGF